MFELDLVVRLVLLAFAGLAIAVCASLLLKHSIGRVSIAGALAAMTLLAANEAREKFRADRNLVIQRIDESNQRQRNEINHALRMRLAYWELMDLLGLFKPKENQ